MALFKAEEDEALNLRGRSCTDTCVESNHIFHRRFHVFYFSMILEIFKYGIVIDGLQR